MNKYQSVLGPGGLYRVQQGGHVCKAPRQQVHTANNRDTTKQLVTYDGSVYIPIGGRQGSTYGWQSYDHELAEFTSSLGYYTPLGKIIPFGDRVVFWIGGRIGWGYTPRALEDHVSTLARSPNDHCIVGDTIYVLTFYFSHRYVYAYQYPFTTAPVGVAGYAPTDNNARRIAELNGELYCFSATAAGVLGLYKLTLGVWGLVGAGGAVGHNIYTANFNQFGFWKYNGKLFCATMGTVGNALVDIFEINPTTGVFTNRAAWLPAEWVVNASGDTYAGIFEVPDYIGNNEQMFLVRAGGPAAGHWEMYEFSEGVFAVVDTAASGGGVAEIIHPYAGVVYDESTKGAAIRATTDSVPSNYLSTTIEVFDIESGGAVDVDPRYREDGEETPPYNVCTEKAGVGSSGKTALVSKSAAITVLADLSDNFNDGVLDTDLWEAVDYGIYDLTYDYGARSYYSQDELVKDVVEESGAVRFKSSAALISAHEGVAIKSRYAIRDVFQIDFTIADPENLRMGATLDTMLLTLVKINANEGYGFLLWHDNVPDQINARGIYMDLDTNWQITADLVQVVDGDVIRIARDAADAWTVIHDPAGGATTLLTGIVGQLDLAQPVHIWAGVFAKSGAGGAWYDGVGDAPGYDAITVSGAGSLGRYDGGQRHDFMWDHVADLGADKTITAQLYVDTE